MDDVQCLAASPSARWLLTRPPGSHFDRWRLSIDLLMFPARQRLCSVSVVVENVFPRKWQWSSIARWWDSSPTYTSTSGFPPQGISPQRYSTPSRQALRQVPNRSPDMYGGVVHGSVCLKGETKKRKRKESWHVICDPPDRVYSVIHLLYTSLKSRKTTHQRIGHLNSPPDSDW